MSDNRPRARDLGIPLPGTPGAHNAITDVPGVAVGYKTLFEGDSVRTGVTAILPRGQAGIATPCAAGTAVLNGNGEMTGTTWIRETGSLTLPVTLTSTHSVGAVHEGVIRYVNKHQPALASQWLLPVVAETWDGYLNDLNGLHVRPEHAVEAIENAAGGPVAEGSVGGGTGMTCYGFKGGSGTSSRQVDYGEDRYTVGAFVQANFGERQELRVAGVPVGHDMRDDNPMFDTDWLGREGAGSVVVIVATDAPFLPLQCQALARRVSMGLARTGTAGSHFSGDIFMAFSTAGDNALTSSLLDSDEDAPAHYEQLRFIPWSRIDPFYTAVTEAVEEAVLNALVANDDVVGRNGHRSPGIPVDRLLSLLRK